MGEPTDEATDQAPSPEAIRRRRRWLIAFSALGLATILSVVAVQLFGGDEQAQQRDRALDDTPRSVVLERFDLEPRHGKSRRGLAEFVRRDGETYLRMIAAGLRRTYGEEVYQASLTQKREEKVLGSRPVTSKGVFLGETPMSSEELHSFSRIELRLVGSDLEGSGKLILRGSIPN